MRPKGAGETHRADLGRVGLASVFAEQIDAGAQCCLCELDRTDVVLRDIDVRRWIIGVAKQPIGERPAIGEHPVGLRRAVRADRAVDIEETSEIELTHHLDDPRTADS